MSSRVFIISAAALVAAAVGASNALDSEEKTAFEVVKQPRPSISMVVNHGLTKDIHLKCTSEDGTYVTAIMTFSTTSKAYCTPKNRCHQNATTAAIETCR